MLLEKIGERPMEAQWLLEVYLPLKLPRLEEELPKKEWLLEKEQTSSS